MEVIKREKFISDGTEYEIRITRKPNEFEVRAYLNNEPANGYSYTASFEVNDDYLSCNGEPIFSNLIDAAKNDVTNKAWEKLQEIYARLSQQKAT